jgi:hypothetical protein
MLTNFGLGKKKMLNIFQQFQVKVPNLHNIQS